jgi:hypothetical protein
MKFKIQLTATTLLLASILTSVQCFGQSNDLPRRDSFALNLAVDEVNFYQDEVKSSSYILPDNTIQIYPGEKIFVEMELDGTKIKSMKTVKENLNPTKTVTITFTQQTDGKQHKGMMLKIENPFNYELDYKAAMYLLKYNKWAPTDVSPVRAKIASYETWTDIIITLGLSDWTFK